MRSSGGRSLPAVEAVAALGRRRPSAAERQSVEEAMSIPEFLYRGVSREMHDQNHGVLKPKVTGRPFTYVFKLGEPGLKIGAGGTLGTSEANAVLRHQLNQEGFPTSGVSTTPSLERAKVYALHDRGEGIVYKISTTELKRFSVRVFRVADTARWPSVPDDDEFILVVADGSAIPSEVILELIRVGSA